MKSPSSTAYKALYWGSTLLFSAMMIAAAYGYLTSDVFTKAFNHLGFPPYFRIELAIAKLFGVAALLAPVPRWLKEWAYAGFTITVISAFIAHTSVDGVATALPPLAAFVILMVSYALFRRQEVEAGSIAGHHPVAVG